MTKDQADKPSGVCSLITAGAVLADAIHASLQDKGQLSFRWREMETKPTKRERVKYPNQQLAISHTLG